MDELDMDTAKLRMMGSKDHRIQSSWKNKKMQIQKYVQSSQSETSFSKQCEDESDVDVVSRHRDPDKQRKPVGLSLVKSFQSACQMKISVPDSRSRPES
jgi:hypothetical protein